MPMHDWTRVAAGIYHDFHFEWISRVKHAIKAKLPADFYVLAEQHAGEFGPDVLTLQSLPPSKTSDASNVTGGTTTLTRPKTKFFQESDTEFYLRKQNSISIRHVSGDRVVAMVEIVSPGNKNSTHGIQSFVRKAHDLLDHQIHLLIIDPFPVGPRDPQGLHALIFSEYENNPLPLPPELPLSLLAYECGDTIRAYIEPFAVGDKLSNMPIFLFPGMHISIPLEETYMAAWEGVPDRFRDILTA